MPFSEKVKLEVKRKSDFRCVVCNHLIVEIHHIIPQEENGSDDIENAVALCAHCHNIYGGNRSKREELIRLRDRTYERIEQKFNQKQNYMEIEKAEGKCKVIKEEEDIILKISISEKENFEQAATKIYNLIYMTGVREPETKRTLIVEIRGHRNDEGGFDNDMFELQSEFLMKCMLQFVHILHIPLISVENPEKQQNIKSKRLMIFENSEKMHKAKEELKQKGVDIWCIQEGGKNETRRNGNKCEKKSK